MKNNKLAVVEDNPVERRLYEERLGRKGYSIASFSSGEDLLQSLQHQDYDLILLDQILANGMTGLMVLQQVQELNDKIPIILISSFGSIKLVQSFIKSGGATYVEKPIQDWEYLDQTIRRTIEVANKDARLKKMEEETKRLEMEKEILNSFVKMLSHELKSPMSVILGNIGLALYCLQHELGTDNSLLEYLSTAEKYTKRLGTSLDSLLNAMDIKKNGELLSLNLEDITNKIKSDLEKDLATELSPQIDFQVKSTCLVDAHPDKLFQVLRNLLVNASKYSNKKPIKIICQSCEDDFAEILVIDQGIGIPEEKLQDVFGHAVRIKEAEKQAKGHGFGLFISKKLIESMGGEIQAENRKSGGSIFRVKLKKSSANLSVLCSKRAQCPQGHSVRQ